VEVLRLWPLGGSCGDLRQSFQELTDYGIQSALVLRMFLGDDGSLRGVELRSTRWSWEWGDTSKVSQIEIHAERRVIVLFSLD